jgi:hypothetical protein
MDIKSCPGFVSALCPVIHQRIGGKTAEPAEEIRLLLVRLLGAAIAADPLFINSLDKIVGMLARAAGERFVDLVKEACITSIALANTIARVTDLTPTKRNEAFAILAKGLAPGLRHSQNKVRLLSLQAIGALVRHCGGIEPADWTKDVLPALAGLASDNFIQIREALVHEVAGWMITLQPSMS